MGLFDSKPRQEHLKENINEQEITGIILKKIRMDFEDSFAMVFNTSEAPNFIDSAGIMSKVSTHIFSEDLLRIGMKLEYFKVDPVETLRLIAIKEFYEGKKHYEALATISFATRFGCKDDLDDINTLKSDLLKEMGIDENYYIDYYSPFLDLPSWRIVEPDIPIPEPTPDSEPVFDEDVIQSKFGLPNSSNEKVNPLLNIEETHSLKLELPTSINVEEIKNVFEDMSDGEKIFLVSLSGITELVNSYKKLSDNKGKFEVILFNSLLVFDMFNEKYPNKNHEDTDDFYLLLFEQAKIYDIDLETNVLIEFVNSRYRFFAEELNNMNTSNYIASKLYTAFYITPFAEDPEFSTDLGEFLLFYVGLTTMMLWVRENADKI
ncbi:MAG: hypothetical protein Q8M15_08855 [Bacteroidota bacterium]|nr:hypothetical protein [Bacteroidota bacterium]